MDGRNCYEMSDKLQTNYATLRFQAPQVAREQESNLDTAVRSANVRI